MSEATLAGAASGTRANDALATMAWRNLWRVRRRTWLTASGIAFSVFIIVLAFSIQAGGFAVMIDNITRTLSGHVQAQHPLWQDDPRMRHTVANLQATRELIEAQEGVRAVTPRGLAFALASAGAEGERSFGAQMIGVHPATEFASFTRNAVAGRFLENRGEGYVGTGLARNLGVGAGDEVVILGTSKEGGVAALAVTVVGIFESSMPELNRSTLALHFEDFAEAFGLNDEAHALAVLAEDAAESDAVAGALAAAFAEGTAPLRFLAWQTLQPEVQQMMDMKFASNLMIGALLMLLVTFSVANAFVMTVFERTAEFGMLKAVGVSPAAIWRMLQVEALWMSLLGVAIGLGLSGAVLAVFADVGLNLGEDYAQLLAQFNMPDRLYPSFHYGSALAMSAVMLVAVQLAVLLPARRIRRLNVIEALREQE